MKLSHAAAGFSAMGSEPRLEVLQQLVKAGDQGLSVGDIQKSSGIAASTLSYHLDFLASAKLIHQKKQARALINTANFDHLRALAVFILEDCCADEKPES